MFWTDVGDAAQGQSAKIETAAMDGSRRKVIVSTNLGLPRAITVDNPVGLGGRIYWSDSFLKLIESTTLEGTDRRNLLGEECIPGVSFLVGSPLCTVTRTHICNTMQWSSVHDDCIFLMEYYSFNGNTSLFFDKTNIYILKMTTV